jgi:hypothetical protein
MKEEFPLVAENQFHLDSKEVGRNSLRRGGPATSQFDAPQLVQESRALNKGENLSRFRLPYYLLCFPTGWPFSQNS